MSETLADPASIEMVPRVELNIADEFQPPAVPASTPWYLVGTTTTTLWWSYLVVGEFVLSGLPETLGWLMVVALGASNYWAMERRHALCLASVSLAQRGKILGATMLTIGVTWFLAILIGSFVPEPLFTLMLFPVAGAFAWRMRKTRRRIFSSVQPDMPPVPAWRLAAIVVTVTLSTMLAMAAVLARQ